MQKNLPPSDVDVSMLVHEAEDVVPTIPGQKKRWVIWRYVTWKLVLVIVFCAGALLLALGYLFSQEKPTLPASIKDEVTVHGQKIQVLESQIARLTELLNEARRTLVVVEREQSDAGKLVLDLKVRIEALERRSVSVAAPPVAAPQELHPSCTASSPDVQARARAAMVPGMVVECRGNQIYRYKI